MNKKRVLLWYDRERWDRVLRYCVNGLTIFGNTLSVESKLINSSNVKKILTSEYDIALSIVRYNEDYARKICKKFRKSNTLMFFLSDGCFFDYYKRVSDWDKNKKFPWSVFINGAHTCKFSYKHYRNDLPENRVSLFKPDIKLKPWIKGKDKVLIATQRGVCCNNRKKTMVDAYSKIIDEYLSISDRPIVFRLFPNIHYDPIQTLIKEKMRNKRVKYEISVPRNSRNPYSNFKNIRCLITYNSKISSKSILKGIPSITYDYSMAEMVSQRGIKSIENLKYPNRKPWQRWLSYCHWTPEEMNNGETWRFFADNGYVTF